MASGLGSTIGKYLREYRKANKLTQAELAEKVGLNAITIRRYERAERDMPIEKWLQIAEVFNLDKKEAERHYLESDLIDFGNLRDECQQEVSRQRNRIETNIGLLNAIYLSLPDEGQKRLIQYAKDMQAVFGGVNNGQG